MNSKLGKKYPLFKEGFDLNLKLSLNIFQKDLARHLVSHAQLKQELNHKAFVVTIDYIYISLIEYDDNSDDRYKDILALHTCSVI